MAGLSIHEKRHLAEQIAREQLNKSGQYRFGIPQNVLNAKANEFMRLSDKELQKKFNEYFQSTGLNEKPKDLWDSMGLNLEQKKKAEAHMKGLQKQINKKYMRPATSNKKKTGAKQATNSLPNDVKKETRQFMIALLKQAFNQKSEEFRNYLLNNKGGFAEGAMELHDLGSAFADKLTEIGIVVDRGDTRAEIREKLIKKQAEIDVLESYIGDEKSFNELFKKYFNEDFDYQSTFDYICASTEFTTQDSSKKIEKFNKKIDGLTKTNLKSADDYMGNASKAGGLMDLAFNVALMYVSGGSSAIGKYAQMTAKGGTELAENAITKVAGKKFAQSSAGQAMSQGVGIVAAQTTSAGLNAVAFQGTKTAELAGETLATGEINTEKAKNIVASAEGLFKFGYVGGAISGPLGMQVKNATTKLLNSKPIINQILTKGITNKPAPLTSILKNISEYSEAIGEVLKFGTEFGINAGYMAYDDGVSYTDAMANLAQMDGVSKMVLAMLGAKNMAFLTPEKVQQIKTDLAGYKVNIAIYEGQKVYSVKDAKGKETVLATPEELFMFILDKEAQMVGVNAEHSKADNTPHPNPSWLSTINESTASAKQNASALCRQSALPQGAREQSSVHVDKNADGTFNVKDGDYYWHVKNNEELSFVTDYLSQRKDLSGMLIKEKVRDDGSKLIKEVDPQTGKSVRTTKVNSEGSIEYITFYEHKNGVTTKSVELHSDKACVTDYRTSNGKYQESKETEIYSNGQKDVTVYDSYGKVEEKYSIPNVELVVNKDGSYVSEENIDILMQKFGITDKNEAAMLLENVIDCGVNDRFLRILTNLNDTNKNIILPLVKNNKTAYIAYEVMENVNAANKDVLEFATKNLNIDELQLYDLSSFTDEINASRILNALKEGKDLRVLSNKYHDLKCIYDPIMQKMDSTNKVEFIQKEIASFEQDLSKITNEPLKYTDLFELKLQNKERYERILNSGLIKALENGTVKNVKIPRLANADLSPEIYSDLKLLKEGKSIVKEFSADTDINEAYKATSIGDVVEVGKQMYINDGKKLSKWNMTKEMFLKLFPPVDRFAFKQKKLGDCYLLSSISSVMRNKKASVTFYQSFEYDGKDVKVTVKAYEDYNGSQTFTNGELSNLGKKQVEGCRGVQLYERTYAKVALREQDIIYPNTAESKALMQRINGGNSSQAIQEILGTKAMNDNAKSGMMIKKSISIPYKRNSASTVNVELAQFNSKGIQDILNNFKENQPNTSIALYLGNSKNIKTVIDYLANNDDIILNFGTKHDLKLTDILKKQHAYSVCGYNKSTGIVKVVDPYNNSNVKEIHIDELSKLTDTIYITNLAK